MSFKTPNTPASVEHPVLSKSEERTLLQSELAEIKRQIEEAIVRREALPVDAAEEERLRTSIEEMLKELDEVAQALALAKEDLQAAQSAHAAEVEAHDETIRRHVAQSQVYEKTSEAHELLKRSHGTLLAKHEQLQKDHEALENTIKAKALEEGKRIAALTVHAREDLAKLNRDIAKASEELAGLAINRRLAATLKEQIMEAKQTLADLLKQVAAQQKVVQEFEATLSGAEQKRQETLAQEEKEAAKRTAVLDEREAALSKREGDLNFSALAIKNKAALLRQAKQDLEVFHGKQLQHIRIPDDEFVG